MTTSQLDLLYGAMRSVYGATTGSDRSGFAFLSGETESAPVCIRCNSVRHNQAQSGEQTWFQLDVTSENSQHLTGANIVRVIDAVQVY